MARDLYVMAGKQSDFKQAISKVFSINGLSKEEASSYLEKLEISIKIEDLLGLEAYLEQETKANVSDFLEIFISFRSKAICFAIAQTVAYYNAYFSNAWEVKPRFEMQENCMLFSKGEIVEVLTWLSLVSAQFDQGAPLSIKLKYEHFELNQKAEKFVEEGNWRRI